MYAPKGKMGLTLKFTSQEGHFGTMQMTGGMSRSEELGECRRFWIEERQSVPGFLAQVTTEMFEKTTVSAYFISQPKTKEEWILERLNFEWHYDQSEESYDGDHGMRSSS